ncbi:hypothetical protein BDB00DRAFT_859311 [Zychaea mexicana]|uniref:uncharacterized protein n=1 Tax=Zychaea mexicana TaxID=64656 RepID=UPI0022FF28C8|nr:uncharacterized protein BDB00DRAFT_859311 [Zychaea mexicana]KAI9477170.1 hypothetical protein BDB00DRAFT_859311 [Zychaea mexicana]
MALYEQITIAALDVEDFELAQDEAQTVYDSILEKDATHLLASKRQIVLLKERNKTEEAIAAMTEYLDTYYDDHEGWIELCNMELIILQPANHIWYLKYAEIVYTLGNWSLAMKHYCKVLELCTDNVRALYGLQLCASKLTGADHGGDLHALATERLLAVYSKQPEHVRQLVQDYLAK